MTELGIFGGTFNPIHNAAINLAKASILQFNLDKLIFVPNGNPPHKKSDVLDKEYRYEMVAAAVLGEKQIEASRIEVDRQGITWSIDTLREFKQIYGNGVRLNFIMGEDNIKTLETYPLRAEFLMLCRILVAPRIISSQTDLATWRKILPEACIEMIQVSSSALSATEIRAKIRRNEDISSLVPPAVLQLIESRGHYKVNNSVLGPVSNSALDIDIKTVSDSGTTESEINSLSEHKAA